MEVLLVILQEVGLNSLNFSFIFFIALIQLGLSAPSPPRHSDEEIVFYFAPFPLKGCWGDCVLFPLFTTSHPFREWGLFQCQ